MVGGARPQRVGTQRVRPHHGRSDWDKTIRGVETYTNPKTGKRMEVSVTGADKYAQDDAGHVLGIMGSEPPPGLVLLQKGAR